MNQVILVTGGSRSGKSNYALKLAASYQNKVLIATAQAVDDEMRDRIERHQNERDPSYLTVEEPVDLARALRDLPERTDVAVLDCITVWLGNLSYQDQIKEETSPEIEAFFKSLDSPPCLLILVSNEVGMGIIPGDEGTRRFRDLAGSINQRLAEKAHEVFLMVCGIAVKVK